MSTAKRKVKMNRLFYRLANMIPCLKSFTDVPQTKLNSSCFYRLCSKVALLVLQGTQNKWIHVLLSPAMRPWEISYI